MGFRSTTFLALGAQAVGAYTLSNPDLTAFKAYDQSFANIVGSNASIELLYNATEALFHEGAVYNSTGDALYVSSNRIELPAGQVDETTSNQTIKFSAVNGVSSTDLSAIAIQPLSTSDINLPNGGVAYLGSSGLLWTAQGSKTATAGIYSIPDPINQPNTSIPVVTSFYGRPFNSPNDVVVSPVDGSIWFTDPDYGFRQGLRDSPNLPPQVYRYDPVTNATRVVADGFSEPNGLAFNADASVLYVTDTGASNVDNAAGPAVIYAYDVDSSLGPFLVNKRVFAYAPSGLPDGIKVDAAGNVWSGTGEGVSVWDKAGTLLGAIVVQDGVANFGFGSTERTLFVLNEKLLWRVNLG